MLRSPLHLAISFLALTIGAQLSHAGEVGGILGRGNRSASSLIRRGGKLLGRGRQEQNGNRTGTDPVARKQSRAQPAPNRTRRIEQLVLQYINKHRRSQRVAALRNNVAMTNLARRHSQSMAGKMRISHDGMKERFAAIRRDGRGPVGENVARTFRGTDEEVARRAVDMWIKSPVHLRNLSNPKFSRSGIGVKQVGKGFFLTHLFGG